MDKNLQVKNVYKKRHTPFFDSTMVYLLLLTCFVGVRIFASFNLLEFLGEFENLVYALIIQVGILLGLGLVLYKSFTKQPVKKIFKKFRFKKISFKAVLICIGIGILIIFLNIAINSIYTMILTWFGYTPSTSSKTSYALSTFLITIFASAVLPGFCEEFANRGILLSGLKKLGFKKAMVISGFCFGLMHLNIGQFGYAFIIGMYFAFLWFATGSIVPGIILHFLNNSMVEYLSFAQINGLPFGNIYSQFNALFMTCNFLTSVLVIFILLMIVIFLFAWLTYLLIKETRVKQLKIIGKEIAHNVAPLENAPTALRVDLPMSVFGLNTKQTYFPKLKEKIPLISIIFLGSIVTVMTFIWATL